MGLYSPWKPMLQLESVAGSSNVPGYPGNSGGQKFRLIYQLHPLLEKRNLDVVIHALVISRLDYCNVH